MWAECLAVGIEDAVYWSSTPWETWLLLRAINTRRKREDRAAAVRAGLVAAAVYNVNRKRGTSPLKATDFVAEEVQIVSAEEMKSRLDAWAASHNREHKA